MAEDAALYWNKISGNLAKLIDKTDEMNSEKSHRYGAEAKERISNAYSWEYIGQQYKGVLLNDGK